ncbi:MAG TPA: GTP 3',8-cyclase MoaA [archaeon]|nr:GTP 3',8-cyclase MoaA [archaeon]
MGFEFSPLVDYYGRAHTYLRISVTDRCNLRCIYCVPHDGDKPISRPELLSFAEIIHLARLFAGMGVTKVRLTGGEPLLRENIEHLVGELACLPGIQAVGMTTNGVLLKEKLPHLKAAGLKLLNISLDTLKPERFERIAQRDLYHKVREGLDQALENGFFPLKLNTVIKRGMNDNEIMDFVELARKKPVHIRFIEYMPFRSNQWQPDDFVSAGEIKSMIERKYRLLSQPQEDDGTNDSRVAKNFRIDGFCGTVGFITPLSDNFCRYCNRLRLTADGNLKLCLYHPEEINLRSPLRTGVSDFELARLIRSGLEKKPLIHPAVEALNEQEDRTMIEMGG